MKWALTCVGVYDIRFLYQVEFPSRSTQRRWKSLTRSISNWDPAIPWGRYRIPVTRDRRAQISELNRDLLVNNIVMICSSVTPGLRSSGSGGSTAASDHATGRASSNAQVSIGCLIQAWRVSWSPQHSSPLHTVNTQLSLLHIVTLVLFFILCYAKDRKAFEKVTSRTPNLDLLWKRFTHWHTGDHYCTDCYLNPCVALLQPAQHAAGPVRNHRRRLLQQNETVWWKVVQGEWERPGAVRGKHCKHSLTG